MLRVISLSVPLNLRNDFNLPNPSKEEIIKRLVKSRFDGCSITSMYDADYQLVLNVPYKYSEYPSVDLLRILKENLSSDISVRDLEVI